MTATRTRSRDRVVRSEVDPRLQERRRQVAHADRHRRRRTLVMAGVVLAVVGSMVGVLFSPLLDVDRIDVEGAGRLSSERIVQASGLSTGDRMVEVDLAEARDAVLAVPGVRSAQVLRDWPSTVRIVVAEDVPLAEVRVGAQQLVVSRTGRVLDGVQVGDDPMVVVTVDVLEPVEGDRAGERFVPPEVLAAAQTVDRMVDAAREQVAGARLDGGSLTLELVDGATVAFGPAEDLPAKLGAAEAVLTQVEPGCRAVIDVREPSRVTVSRVPGCEPPPVTDPGASGGQAPE